MRTKNKKTEIKTAKTPLEKFKAEISKCMLIKDEEKTYWLDNAVNLPEAMLNDMCAYFKDKNDTVDRYVRKAIEEDPGVVVEMKNKVLTMKKHMLKFKEAQVSKSENAERALEEAMKKIKD